MAHFLEADLQPWAAALVATLFAPQPAEEGRERVWNVLDALAPLGDAVDAVLRASRLPLLEQLPRTPAEWQPAVIGSHAVAGALTLSYDEAAACCDAPGAHEACETAAGQPRACAAEPPLSTLRALRLCLASTHDGSGSFPSSCAPAVTRQGEGIDPAVLARPLCVLTTLTRLEVSIAIAPASADALAAGLPCLSQLADLKVHALSCDGAVVALAQTLGTLTTLTALHLGHQGLEATGAEALALALRPLSRLEALGSAGHHIRADGVAALAPALGGLTALTSLNLSRNLIGDDGAEALAPALRRLSRLAHLNLAWSLLGEAAFTLAPAIALLTTLTLLDLHRNRPAQFDNPGVKPLVPALSCLSARLADLDLADNDLSAAQLASPIALLTALTRLSLMHIWICANGAHALAPALDRLSERLADLDLARNNLGAAGAAALASPIGLQTALTRLCLDQNGLGADGAAALAPALNDLSRLASFSMSKNYIGAAGTGALAPPLGRLTALTLLQLNCNDIGDDGAASLAPVLSGLSRLAGLALKRNDIRAAGAAALAPALGCLPALTFLDLSHNYLRHAGLQHLAPALARLTGLKSADLSGNGAPASAVDALLAQLPAPACGR